MVLGMGDSKVAPPSTSGLVVQALPPRVRVVSITAAAHALLCKMQSCNEHRMLHGMTYIPKWWLAGVGGLQAVHGGYGTWSP